MLVTRRIVACAVVALFALVASSPAISEAGPFWRSRGPEGGLAAAVAIDPSNPSTVYASNVGGLFKSTDAGVSWTNASIGLPHADTTISSIVVDPSDSNVVYVADAQFGVFKSTNGGASWSDANTGIPPASAPWSLAVDPDAPGTLYVGLLAGGVYTTTDGAASWSPANIGLPPLGSIFALAIDASSPTTLWAAAYTDGVYKTTDGGITWNPANGGLPPATAYALVSSPSNPNRLYLGTLDNGAFRSNDGGDSWNPVNGSLPSTFVSMVAVAPSEADHLYVSSGNEFRRSTSGGNAFQLAMTPPTGSLNALAVDPTDPTIMHLASSDGVFKSDDRGRDWETANTGFAASDVRAIAVDPATPTTSFAATYGLGVFKSTNGTASWSAVNDGITNPNTTDVVIDPSTPTTVYVSTAVGVAKTVNGGASWTDADTGLPSGAVCLAIDPATPATLYACTNSVYKTTNGGGSWSLADTGIPAVSVRDIVIDPATPATVYAATSAGVYKTVDGGGTWNPMNTGLGWLDVRAIAVDPATPTTLHAGAGHLVYATTDGGTTWSPAGSVTNVVSLAVDPATPSTVYAGSYGLGAFRSTNGGASFSAINDGLSSQVVAGLTVDAAGVAYAGTIGGGAFRLTDCGNGAPELGEQCDDGNETAGDGCSATCTLEPCSATPAPFCRIATQAQMQFNEKTIGKEKLKVGWKKVAGVTTLADFGDPIAGTTSAVLCLYDDGGTLIEGYEVDRAGDMCGTKPCWSPKGSTGLGYKDKTAAATGITKIGFKAGAALKAKADMAGANNAAKGQVALPTGVVAALSGNDAPTMQLLTSDGLCISATMTEVTRDDGLEYKAKK